MVVFFMFLVGVLNLGLGFAAAVVIKRRYEAQIATEPTGQALEDQDLEDQLGFGVDEEGKEAIEAVEALLSTE